MEKGQVFGLNIGELLTIYDHDLQLWKMSECLFTGDYGKYSEALPRSGIMLNGKIYEQATWVPRTGGKGSGLLPTPDTCQGEPNNHYKGLGHIAKHNPQMWPTPQARAQQDCPAERDRHTPCLESAVKKRPTPTTRDWKDGTAKSCENVPVNGLLGRTIHHEKFRTPDTCMGGTKSKEQYEKAKKTGCNAIRLQDQILHDQNAGTTGSLNPTWVEGLMGYPYGWGDMLEGG